MCFRPELYIAEVLPDLNQTLATRTSQPEEVVLLSIQTLCILVEYEVLDIMSTWEVIASHFSSAQKSRYIPLRICICCEVDSRCWPNTYRSTWVSWDLGRFIMLTISIENSFLWTFYFFSLKTSVRVSKNVTRINMGR